MIPIRDSIPSKTFPYVNWLIIALNLAVFLFELSLGQEALESMFYLYGLVPARYSNPEWGQSVGLESFNYIPFLSNIFLHGGWAHFIGNMWTLYIFGDNVEDRMGHGSYFLFYLISGIAATATHYFLNINSTIPALGASGAISGVMAAYMFLFPKSKILFFIPIFFLPYLVEISALIYIGFWFMMQLFSGTVSLVSTPNATGIAFWAHIGGFIAGMVIFRFFLKAKKQKQDDDTGWAEYEEVE